MWVEEVMVVVCFSDGGVILFKGKMIDKLVIL